MRSSQGSDVLVHDNGRRLVSHDCKIKSCALIGVCVSVWERSSCSDGSASGWLRRNGGCLGSREYGEAVAQCNGNSLAWAATCQMPVAAAAPDLTVWQCSLVCAVRRMVVWLDLLVWANMYLGTVHNCEVLTAYDCFACHNHGFSYHLKTDKANGSDIKPAWV